MNDVDISKCSIPLMVELGEIELPIGDVSRIRPGDVIRLEVRQPARVRVSLQGAPILHGSLSIEGDLVEIAVDRLVFSRSKQLSSGISDHDPENRHTDGRLPPGTDPSKQGGQND